MFATGPIEAIDEPLPAAVLAQKRLTPETGEGQGMGVARSVVAFAGFPMGPSEVTC